MSAVLKQFSQAIVVYLSLCLCSNTALKSYHMKCSCFGFHLTHIHMKHNQSRDSLWDRRSHLCTDHIHAQERKPYTHTDQQERLNLNHPNKRFIILAQALDVFTLTATKANYKLPTLTQSNFPGCTPGPSHPQGVHTSRAFRLFPDSL